MPHPERPLARAPMPPKAKISARYTLLIHYAPKVGVLVVSVEAPKK